jgi:hypothetical protein
MERALGGHKCGDLGPELRSLPGAVSEVEHDILYSLRGCGHILPLQNGLGGVLRKHGIAALDIYFGDTPVRKYGGFEPDLSLKMTVLENVRIFRCYRNDNFPPGFGILSDRARDECAGDQNG